VGRIRSGTLALLGKADPSVIARFSTVMSMFLLARMRCVGCSSPKLTGVFHVAEKARYKLHIPPKKKQEVVSVYSSIYCKQIDALLATKRIALISDCFCNMRGCGASGA